MSSFNKKNMLLLYITSSTLWGVNGTHLMQAAKKRDFTKLVNLLEDDSNVSQINVPDKHNDTVLIVALNRRAPSSVIRTLIDKGADVTLVSSGETTPLMFAIGGSPLESVELLIKNGALKTLKNVTPEGKTVLTHACESVLYNTFPRIKYLIELDPELVFLGDLRDSLKNIAAFNDIRSLELLMSKRNFEVDFLQEVLDSTRGHANVSPATKEFLTRMIYRAQRRFSNL